MRALSPISRPRGRSPGARRSGSPARAAGSAIIRASHSPGAGLRRRRGP